MSTKTFFMRDCPPEQQVANWLDSQTGFRELGRRLRPSRPLPPIFELQGLDLDAGALETSIREVFAEHGWHGWRHTGGETKAYGGFSLVSNPDREERRNVHADVLGGEGYDSKKIFDSALPGGRGSYADGYSFRARTPGSRHGHLGRLIDGFRRPLVRSSVRELRARHYTPDLVAIKANHPEASRVGWHCDEMVFENLRINIPVTSDPIFQLEIAGVAAPHPTVFMGHLLPGRAYVWDTYWPHRPLATEPRDISRISIVLGFSPWFDYLPEVDAWRANEFLGVLHPFDMLAEGLIHPGLRIETPSGLNA